MDDPQQNPVVSVIVPVYNVEPYLDRCVESLTTQTLTNIEILLIDDGSTDRSPEMCDAWKEKDERIKVFHKQNGGPSDARNFGIEKARADYVGFVDSDDWVEPSMFETLYASIIEDESEIAICGTREINQNRIVDPPHEGHYVQTGTEALRDQLIGDVIHVWIPTKLYAKHIVESKPLPMGLAYEDTFIVVDWFLQVKRVSVDLAPLYCYCRHEDSLSAMRYTPQMADHLVAAQHVYETIMREAPELEAEAKLRLYWAYFNVLDAMFSKGAVQDDETKSKIVAFLRENEQDILSNPHVGRGRKTALKALMIGVPLYRVFSRAYARKMGR